MSVTISCPICYETFTPEDNVHSTSCGHIFHNQCIEEWKKQSELCPQCNSRSVNSFRIYLNILDNNKEIELLRKQRQENEAKKFQKKASVVQNVEIKPASYWSVSYFFALYDDFKLIIWFVKWIFFLCIQDIYEALKILPWSFVNFVHLEISKKLKCSIWFVYNLLMFRLKLIYECFIDLYEELGLIIWLTTLFIIHFLKEFYKQRKPLILSIAWFSVMCWFFSTTTGIINYGFPCLYYYKNFLKRSAQFWFHIYLILSLFFLSNYITFLCCVILMLTFIINLIFYKKSRHGLMFYAKLKLLPIFMVFYLHINELTN